MSEVSVLRFRQDNNITTHNINGLKNDKSKLLNLATWGKANRIPIIGLSETNIDKKLGGMYNTNDLQKHEDIPVIGPQKMTR